MFVEQVDVSGAVARHWILEGAAAVPLKIKATLQPSIACRIRWTVNQKGVNDRSWGALPSQYLQTYLGARSQGTFRGRVV